jgi:hypothetical protein
MEKGRKTSNGRFVKAYDKKITKEYLEKEYSNNKKGPYIIAQECGVSPRTIYNYLEYYNISREKRTKEIKPGDTFKLLTAINVCDKGKNGVLIWLCKCHCGNFTKVRTTQLKNGRIVSCGCYRKRYRNHRWTGYCGISGSRVAEIRLRAKKKGLQFDLTAKFLWELFEKQNKKCAITGIEIDLDKNGSVDRIDSTKGYTKDNVWWTDIKINKMKLDFSLSEFLMMCEQVTNNKEQINYGRD